MDAEFISPLLGVTMASACLLLAGLGFVVRLFIVERRLDRIRSEYLMRRTAYLRTENAGVAQFELDEFR